MCNYRILTNKGTVDYATDLQTAEKKYKKYAIDMLAGYSKFVELVEVNKDFSEKLIAKINI